MLISELYDSHELSGSHWLITWDNPEPADSSSMLADLSSLGKLYTTKTKTTAILAPKKTAGWKDIRKTIVKNMNKSKGKVVYANLKSGNIFEWTAFSKKWIKKN